MTINRFLRRIGLLEGGENPIKACSSKLDSFTNVVILIPPFYVFAVVSSSSFSSLPATVGARATLDLVEDVRVIIAKHSRIFVR